MRRDARYPTKGWFRFGPGLILAVLASVAVWAFYPREHARPTVTRTIVPVPAGLPSAPDPHWLLGQRESLRVTPRQSAALERLSARWDRETAPLRAEIAERGAAFERSMSDRSGKPANLAQVQQEATGISALSRQLADARRAWWAEAARTLSPEQKKMAEAAWAGHWTERNGRNPS